MYNNAANYFAQRKSEYAILNALKDLALKRFTEILTSTKLSTRTLSRNLKNLHNDRALIDKQGRRYRITAMGLEYLQHLTDELDKYDRHKKNVASIPTKRLRNYAVEVTTVTPSGGICVGIFQVSLSRQLRHSDAQRMRSEMEQALTKAIHVVAKNLPNDSKTYNVAITGTSK